MNINEVEKLTGISKPNIRFYERKGLIKPKRNKGNDYRDYSNEDIDVLKQIKLFRLLSFSIDEISEMLESGKLIDVEEHIKSLEDQINLLNGSIEMCRRLKDEKSINALDTNSYLEEIRNLENKGESFNSFNNDFRAFLNYKETKKIIITPDYTILDEGRVIEAIEEYAKNNDLDLEFINKSICPKFYLNGLRYHAYVARYNVRADYIICVCDEELIEPKINPKHKSVVKITYYLPLIAAIVLLMTFFIAERLPNYVSIPLIVITALILIASIAYWASNRKRNKN